jgi:hypothetical protein
LYYGVAQTLIFSCFFVGAYVTKVWLNKYSVISLIRNATLLAILGAILFWYVALFHAQMPLIVISMMLISFASSILFGPLNRVAIEASHQPMGRRTAIFSTTISIFGVFTGCLLQVINKGSIATVSILVLISMIIAALMIMTIDGDALKQDD